MEGGAGTHFTSFGLMMTCASAAGAAVVQANAVKPAAQHIETDKAAFMENLPRCPGHLRGSEADAGTRAYTQTGNLRIREVSQSAGAAS